jgi:hypothetical protein
MIAEMISKGGKLETENKARQMARDFEALR